jgi:peptide/nickel transport system substrate-binding protein
VQYREGTTGSARQATAGLWWSGLLLLGLVLAMGSTWCLTRAAASPSPVSSPPSGDQIVLKLGWTEEPDNLNVFIGSEDTCYEVWALNYSYLFGSNNQNQPSLDLAHEFPTVENGGISADGKVWTIHIRSGVRFDDGTPLTAADVAFTYNYIIKNNLANYMNYVQGIETVTALNPTTVRFVCAHPMAMGYMETQSVPILPKHIWEHVSPAAATTSYGDKPPIIGSGPFETVGYVKGSYIEMVRNPYYYGKRPTIDTIYFEAYQNADTMVNDLEKGRLDGAWGVPVGEFLGLESAKAIKAIAYPYYGWDYLQFNCYDKPSSLGNPVLRDWRFRQALNYAIDKQRLCRLAYNGLATPATTIILPNVWSNPDYHWQPSASAAYTFDLARASQMLTAAGYPLKNGVRLNKQGKPIVLRLWAPTDQPAEQIEAKLITGWLQQLGLTIKLAIVDPGALEADMYNGHGTTWQPNFDLIVWEWTGYFDPGQTLDALTTSEIGNLNDPYWSDPQYDQLAVTQASAVDPQQRAKIIWQMQQIMYQQSPWIPLTYPENLEAINTAKWTGWTQLWGTGPAWNCEGNISSYLDLRPVTATAATASSSGSSATVAVFVIIIVIAAGVAFVVVRRRRAGRTEDEA